MNDCGTQNEMKVKVYRAKECAPAFWEHPLALRLVNLATDKDLSPGMARGFFRRLDNGKITEDHITYMEALAPKVHLGYHRLNFLIKNVDRIVTNWLETGRCLDALPPHSRLRFRYRKGHQAAKNVNTPGR